MFIPGSLFDSYYIINVGWGNDSSEIEITFCTSTSWFKRNILRKIPYVFQTVRVSRGGNDNHLVIIGNFDQNIMGDLSWSAIAMIFSTAAEFWLDRYKENNFVKN